MKTVLKYIIIIILTILVTTYHNIKHIEILDGTHISLYGNVWEYK